ncbi:MAG TPA: ABC transporter [Nocardioidaceae bacterium]|nr:ABC transporter [Nocardioidaceae bacterium]
MVTPPDALVRLRDVLGRTALPLDVPDAERHRAARREMVEQLDDYVLPRLAQIEAPLLTVVGGSTGAGKSTLVNTLVGRRVTEHGVLRPTTRSPVLVHHPADAQWFADGRILPGLARTGRATGDPGALQLVADDGVPEGLAVLDAPDIDSVERANRTLATELLAAADLWLFVTSAARYADQVPWAFLQTAAERSTAVAIVLDRTPPEAVEEVSVHLARMLTDRGLRDSPLFTVTEGEVSDEGLLRPEAVAEIRTWLHALAADANARQAVVRQTLDGAVRSLARRTHDIADAVEEQVGTAVRLRQAVDTAYDEAVDRVDDASADGTLLRGEVLARWQEFVGTGELLRSLESRVGWLRDRFTSWVRGRPQQAERVTVAVESGLESLIMEQAENAAERSEASWRSLSAGQHLLEDSGRDLGRASRDLRPRAERAVRDWQHGVLEMVRTEGADKRTTARFLAFGVNGLSLALMVVVFASTAAIPTGAEVGVASGGVLLGQKLLEAVFGDQAVRRLSAQARKDLAVRVGELMDSERRRYLEVLDRLDLDPDATARLREAARGVDDLRIAGRVLPPVPRPDEPDGAGER